MEINDIITILSLVLAVAVLGIKLLWAKEYRFAKDEIIKAKDAHIELLKAQTPKTIKEYHDAVTTELNSYIEKLKRENNEYTAQLEKMRETLKENISRQDAIEKVGKMLLLAIDDEYLKAKQYESTLIDKDGLSAADIILERVNQKFPKFHEQNPNKAN